MASQTSQIFMHGVEGIELLSFFSKVKSNCMQKQNIWVDAYAVIRTCVSCRNGFQKR